MTFYDKGGGGGGGVWPTPNLYDVIFIQPLNFVDTSAILFKYTTFIDTYIYDFYNLLEGY